MERYHVLHLIGQGCFGKVFKGRRRFSGQLVALKFISKRGKPEKELQNLRLEIGILKRLDHPNIIRMLDSFETSSDFVVVTEFAYGELFEIFQDDKSLPEDEVRHIARQLTQALFYLHSQKIIHRDMKPQNVLVGANDTIKLCDFGFARVMSCQTTVLTSIKGTPLYMAPELVQEQPYDCSADLWSLGVICYELFVGQPPFYTNSLISLIHLIVDKAVKYPENMSADFRSFLQGLLQKNPKQRLGWPDLLHHPFIEDAPPSTPVPKRPDPRLAREPSPLSAVKVPRATAAPPAAGSPGLEALGRQLALFACAGATPPTAGRSGEALQGVDEAFAGLCLTALTLYADVVEEGLLTVDAPHVERQGLLLSLGGEPQQQGATFSLPLLALLRGLAHILSLATPPPAVLPRLLSSPALASQLLRIARPLSGRQAAAWGPAWDLLSELVRLLGLWLRAPLALGMGSLAEELLVPDGTLMQCLALAPALIAGGSTGHFAPERVHCIAAAGVHHLGVAVNSVKCLGVVFSHLSQAAASQPPSRFALELLQGLADEPTAPPGRGEAVAPQRAAVLAVGAVCHCVVLRTAPGASSERLVRAALQAAAALLHAAPGPERGGAAWCLDPSRQPRCGAAEAARLHAAVRGAREAVRSGLRSALAEAARPMAQELDDAVFALLWELRTAPGGERLDASALKVLRGLASLSAEAAQRLAALPAVAESLLPEASAGPGNVLAAVEAACTGAAEQGGGGGAWPGVGLLLAVLVQSLGRAGELPHAAPCPGELSPEPPLPRWCSLVTVQALAVRLRTAVDQPPDAAPAALCAGYALELLAALAAALLRRSGQQLRLELRRVLTQVDGVVDAVLIAVVKGRAGKQCQEEMRKAEGGLHGYPTRGPLDGPLAVAATLHATEEEPQASIAGRAARFLASADDAQAVLSAVGPRGLLRLLELLRALQQQEALEPPAAALRLCLALLWALQGLSALPPQELAGLPPLAAALQAAAELALHSLEAAVQVLGPAELLSELQSFRAVATVLQLVAGVPHFDPKGWQAASEGWGQSLVACLRLLSALVSHHRSLAQEFVQQEGLRMLAERRLLSASLVTSDSGAQLVADALVIVSQLSRLSKDYYPMLQHMSICSDVRDLLACSNANVRAKACSALGNMVRHSDYFFEELRQAGILVQLIPLCGDGDSAVRKFASFALGNSAFHSELLYRELAPAVPQLLRLLEDEDEKTRANAAGAIGNLVRNSAELCGAMLQEGALQGLLGLIQVRRPRDARDAAAVERFTTDSSVKIALFSLGNLAVHGECRAELKASIKATDLCHSLMALCQQDDTIHKYSQRLLQKLAA